MSYAMIENILIGLICSCALLFDGKYVAAFLWIIMGIIIGHAYYKAAKEDDIDGLKFSVPMMLYVMLTAPYAFARMAISCVRQEIDPNYDDDAADYFVMSFEEEDDEEEDNEDDTKT